MTQLQDPSEAPDGEVSRDRLGVASATRTARAAFLSLEALVLQITEITLVGRPLQPEICDHLEAVGSQAWSAVQNLVRESELSFADAVDRADSLSRCLGEAEARAGALENSLASRVENENLLDKARTNLLNDVAILEQSVEDWKAKAEDAKAGVLGQENDLLEGENLQLRVGGNG